MPVEDISTSVDRARYFENSDEAAQFLKRFVTPGDLLLLKGSRGVRMEKILETIDTENRRVFPTPPSETLVTSRKGRD